MRNLLYTLLILATGIWISACGTKEKEASFVMDVQNIEFEISRADQLNNNQPAVFLETKVTSELESLLEEGNGIQSIQSVKLASWTIENNDFNGEFQDDLGFFNKIDAYIKTQNRPAKKVAMLLNNPGRVQGFDLKLVGEENLAEYLQDPEFTLILRGNGNADGGADFANVLTRLSFDVDAIIEE